MRLIVHEYTDCTQEQSRPTLVHHSETGQTLLLLVDASEMAFSSGYQPLIDVVKSSFMDSVFHTAGSLPDRMSRAFIAADNTMRERFHSSTDFCEEQYSAVFVALGLEEGKAFPLWIGSPQAKLFRGGVCVRSTTPHVTAVPNSQIIVTDCSMNTYAQAVAFAAADGPWSLVEKDMLLLADHRSFALFSENDLANVIEGSRSNRAKAFVEAAQSLNYTFARSAIVAHVL
jgi:hypothetical protein